MKNFFRKDCGAGAGAFPPYKAPWTDTLMFIGAGIMFVLGLYVFLFIVLSLVVVCVAPFAHAEDLSRGGEVVTRLAHNQESAGAIPAPATISPDRTRVQLAGVDGDDAALDRLPPQVKAEAVKFQAHIDEIREAAAQLILRVCPEVALKENLSFAEELQACNREIDAVHEAASQGR